MTRAMVRGYVLAVSAAVACGGHQAPSSSSSNSAGPNLDASKKLADLSVTDWQTLCDWTAQQQGGYGSTIVCDAGGNGGSLSAPTDEATCVQEYAEGPNCPATVQQMVSCIQLWTKTWCDTAVLPAECKALKNPC